MVDHLIDLASFSEQKKPEELKGPDWKALSLLDEMFKPTRLSIKEPVIESISFGDSVSIGKPILRRKKEIIGDIPKTTTTSPFFIPAKPKGYKIEDKYFQDFYLYKTYDDREALRRLIDSLGPVIKKGLYTFAPENADLLEGKARIIVKQAIDAYDPKKGNLESYAMLYLQRLMRESPRFGNVVTVSEVQQLETKIFDHAIKELEDQLGRAPSDQEVADYMGVSLRKIKRLRSARGGIPTSQAETAEIPLEHQISDEAMDLIIRTVYSELDPVDQVIMERYFGLNNRQKETIEEIARALKKSTGYVHSRLVEINKKISEMTELL